METFSAEAFSTILAVVGAVIIVAALISGLVERTNFPQVAIFLALGAILGAPGLGLLNINLESPVLRVVATLSLALVLFTDAVGLNVREVRQHGILALRVLGPGTILSAALVALAAWWLLGLSLPAAIILGAALASTDPVLLRGFLRRRDVPAATRQALRLESGLNDVVLLPIVLVAMQFLGGASSNDTNWGSMILNLFVLGPGAGVAIGLLAVATLDMVRRRVGVRRDYESLYSLGVAFAAFAAAEALHGSGFLAAFAAGLTIAALDVELCDCFLEYGETTAEMALLFTFVLFGSSLIWDGLAVLTMASLAFAVLVILIRPITFVAALVGSRLTRRDRALISWFGPRGLSSLLLVLLPVFAGMPGSETLFALCCLVVLLSVVLHGGSLMFVGKGQRDTQPQLATATIEAATPMPAPEAIRFFPTGMRNGPGDGLDVGVTISGSERITIEELQQRLQQGERVLVLDVRTERTYGEDNLNAKGAIRLHPDDAVREAERLRLPRDVLMVAFCA